jgi:hypothetical protein
MMTSSWRYAYDLVVVLLSVVAGVLAILLLRPSTHSTADRFLRAMAWIACALLGLRGVAGLVADGISDLVWSPTFLIGGILFGLVAWRPAAPRAMTR